MVPEVVAEAHLSAEEGPSVRLWRDGRQGLLLGTFSPDEARELALSLWDAADEAEGLVTAKTEPSSKGEL